MEDCCKPTQPTKEEAEYFNKLSKLKEMLSPVLDYACEIRDSIPAESSNEEVDNAHERLLVFIFRGVKFYQSIS